MENPWKIHGFLGILGQLSPIFTNDHQLSTGIPRLRSQEKVEAAQLELERHRKELQRKKEEVQLGRFRRDSGDRSETSAAVLQTQNGKELAVPRHFFHGI